MSEDDLVDLLIVGGGPAGLATAIRGRLAGLSVSLIDRASPPIDKACGEGLMPDAVASLREIGVEPAGVPFRGIRYLDDETVADGTFPRSHGLGVRRIELHRALQARAEEVGVSLRWRVKALSLSAGAVETDAGPLRSRFVVGADGLHSRVRRWAGLERPPKGEKRFGVRRHFAIAPWSDLVEVYWGMGCEAYVTPVAEDEVGVALLWEPRSQGKSSFDQLLEGFPALRERLGPAAILSQDRGAGPLRQRARRVQRGRVALVGDAAGYLDAITGEGLAVAFHEAKALIGAIERGTLASYGRAHRQINRLPNTMTGLMLAVEKRPWLRRRALRALAADPALFSRLLGIHARTLPVRDLGLRGALRLARLVLAS